MGLILNQYRFGGRTLGSQIADPAAYIGDMSNNTGGLSNAFDTTTNDAENGNGVARKTTSSNDGYVGADYTVPGAKRIFQAEVHGSNNLGYVQQASVTVTLDLMAKATTPANSADGTLLGTTSFTDGADESAARTITSTNNETQYTFVWIRVTYTGTASRTNCAELKLYEAV